MGAMVDTGATDTGAMVMGTIRAITTATTVTMVIMDMGAGDITDTTKAN
jgi:hypothetical protein